MANCTLNCIPGIERPPRADWRSALADSIRDPGELCRVLGLGPVLGGTAATAADRWPLLVPRPFLARVRRGDPSDPLLLQVMPREAELSPVPGYSTDPLGEAQARCGPGLLRKYRGRVLMVASGECAVHCRFCFRRHFSFDRFSANGNGSGSFPAAPPHCNGGAFVGDEIRPCNDYVETALQTIATDRSIHEVILSGGDPLMLSDAELADLIGRLAEIPHLRRLRIHSRLPVVIPRRVTGGLIRAIRGSRLPTIMVLHVNHPAEIDGEVAAALGQLIDAGVPVLSQSVLLRGVNDRADVLAELCERLVDRRVMPYYLHQLDAVAGAAHFEVPPSAGKRLIAELRARLPGYAVPRYVRETPGEMCKMILA